MFRPAGQKAEKLMARNKQIEQKALYFEYKLEKLRRERIANEAMIERLMVEERKNRKYKVE